VVGSLSSMSLAKALKLLAKSPTRFIFLPIIVVRLRRLLLMSWEGSGGEGCKEEG